MRGNFLAAWIEHPAAADRREQKGQCELVAEDGRRQITVGCGHGGTWPQREVLEGARVLAQGDFRVGAAVDVVEYYSRQAALCQPPEIGDVDDARRIDRTGHPAD